MHRKSLTKVSKTTTLRQCDVKQLYLEKFGTAYSVVRTRSVWCNVVIVERMTNPSARHVRFATLWTNTLSRLPSKWQIIHH